MKQRFIFKSMAAFVACSFCVFNSMAYDFEVGGLCYDILDGGQVSVVDPNGGNGGGYSGQIDIPATVVNEGVEYAVTAIGEAAFYNCSDITAVTMPSSIVELGDYTFYGASGMQSIIISPSVTELPPLFCNACTSLTTVVIPDGVEKIGAWSFEDCTSLTSVVIGTTANWIGASAFNRCTALTSITCMGVEPAQTVSSSCFQSSYHTATLYVPEEALDAYKSTEYWSWFEFIEPIQEAEILVGDVNDDGNVDISDVVVLIDYLLSGTGDINLDNADVAADGVIGIQDVTSLIDLILTKA